MKQICQWGFALLSTLAIASGASGETIQGKLDREYKQQTGTAITIIFDDSGSMSGKKIRQAKAAFQIWLKTAPNNYRFSLIHFQNYGRIAVPLGDNTKRRVAGVVQGLRATYGTPICNALAVAHKQIKERRAKVSPYERHVVLLFTDGQESKDRRGNSGVQQDIKKLRNENIEVVGIGFHGQGDYMDGVATRFYSATDQAQLQHGLSKVDAEIGDISEIEVTAADLEAMKGLKAAAPGDQGTVTVNVNTKNTVVKAAAGLSFLTLCCFGFPILLGIGIVFFVIKASNKGK
jgi:uncharacterized protein YegL